MSEKIKTVLSSVLAISLVVSVMTVSGYACFNFQRLNIEFKK